MSKRLQRLLWKCPQCKRRFANRNRSHFCGKHDLETHFRRKRKEIRDIYEAVLRAIRRCGPATVLPEKTRIAFQVRMSFAQFNRSFKMGRRACGFGAETRTTAVSKDSDDFAEKSRAPFSVDVGEGGG